MSTRIAVIGAGWAGLSCAHHLTTVGAQVDLYEASSRAGGRARNSTVNLEPVPGTKLQLNARQIKADNGQHMMIGAYSETLSLLRQWSGENLLERVPLQFESDELSLRRRGPGRAGLLWGFTVARGLNFQSRLALARFGAHLAGKRWRGYSGKTVSQLLANTRQTQLLIRAFWQPLCIAAFNTDIDKACAQTFINVLRDAFFSGSQSSDFLVSRVPLGDLFARPMIRQLDKQIDWHPNSLITAISPSPTGPRQWQVHQRGDQAATRINYDAVVLATPVANAVRLLQPHCPAATDRLANFEFASIRTVYLAWPAHMQVKTDPVRMLTESPAIGCHGQCSFQRESNPELTVASVVISLGDRIEADNDTLAAMVARQVHQQCGLPMPALMACINEKRATFVCDPARPVVTATSCDDISLPDGLALAGDYALHRYPATLESAVISGKNAAMAVTRRN